MNKGCRNRSLYYTETKTVELSTKNNKYANWTETQNKTVVQYKCVQLITSESVWQFLAKNNTAVD